VIVREASVTRKRALVVDDSKSARVILSRMLERYDIEVAVAESAEQAIEFLKRDRPDAIFMDHLMPGMDGLQALQAIKSNIDTAAIPIMMYTSQSGEVYLGQARALGATGVLPKQMSTLDVSKVLCDLRLLPERRDATEPALVPVEIEKTAGAANALPTVPNTASVDWARRIEAAMKQQSVDLRRFIVASLDSIAVRLAAESRAATTPPPAALPAQAGAARRGPAWPLAAGLAAALAAALVCAVLLVLAREDLNRSRGEIAALRAANGDLNRAREELAVTVKDLTAALAAAAKSVGDMGSESIAAAGLPLYEPVPYGEAPLDRARLDALRQVLSKLEAQGFRGVVKVTSEAGIFCLTGSAAGGYVPASPTMPVRKCDLIGNPVDDSLSVQQHPSAAFAGIQAGVRQRSHGAITVAFEYAGGSRAGVPYPPRDANSTAGDWNRAAAANNRLEISAETASAP